jgi:hypothetical protein
VSDRKIRRLLNFWLKPSKPATNWPTLKGLSLIAQINFQRAASVQTLKIFSEIRRFLFPIQGIKKPNCRIIIFTRQSDSNFEGAQFIKHAPLVKGHFCPAVAVSKRTGQILYQTIYPTQEIFQKNSAIKKCENTSKSHHFNHAPSKHPRIARFSQIDFRNPAILLSAFHLCLNKTRA